MRDEGQHAAHVDAWLVRAERSASPQGLLRHFEAALGALWTRTRVTLGEVTLTAIAERVFHVASEKFPFLSVIRVDPSVGIVFDDLAGRLSDLPVSDMRQGIRFVLVEWLTVLGNLTAEILTPELHAELARLVPPHAVGQEEGCDAPGPTQRTAAKAEAHEEED